jgi:energy-coupling factor transporter ATP-binding protein EcfA2
MRTSKIKISHALKITELEITDGKSIEITGVKGAGKTSVLDAIRYALTNKKPRDVIVSQGADEAQIIIETDTGLKLERRLKADLDTSSLSLKENGLNVPRPQSFLNEIFTELQLDPVEFIHKPIDEQNRIILSLIKYDWDMSTIEGWFGEIPKGVDYKKDILSVLDQIQAENGVYYQTRQQINSEKLFKKKAAEDIGLSIPAGYNADTWEAYDTAAKYAELNKIQTENSRIERAIKFRESYDNSLRGLQAERDIAIANAKQEVNGEREGLLKTIERLKAEIKAAEDKITGLDSKLKDKERIAQADYETAKAKLDADIGVADQYADKQIIPTDALKAEISNAEAMKKHLNEYRRMVRMQEEVEELTVKSDALTAKIELARKLPGQVLAEAELPVQGLTVKNGKPLVNGLPLSNLSDGEKLDLCVDVALGNTKGLQIILINGAEALDDKSREALYAKCKAKGLQFIATRTTNDDVLKVVEL